MQSAKCRKCGKPVEDIYMTTGLCGSCTIQKARLLNGQLIARIFTSLVTIPLVIGLGLATAGIQSALTTYFFIIYQSFLILIGLFSLWYTTNKLRKY